MLAIPSSMVAVGWYLIDYINIIMHLTILWKNPLGLLSTPAMDLTVILSAFTFSSLKGRNIVS